MASNNANAQSLQIEIKALETLNNFLVDNVCNHLIDTASEFEGCIYAMESTGIPSQECDIFNKNYYSVDKRYFESLIRNIETKDLVLIRRFIQQIESQFHSIGMNAPPTHLHQPKQPSNTTPRSMQQRNINGQDYEKQLDALVDFMNTLYQFREDINQKILKGYTTIMNNMQVWGVPVQVLRYYWQECGKPNGDALKTIRGHIEKDDYDQLKGLFVEISKSLATVQGTYSRAPKSM